MHRRGQQSPLLTPCHAHACALPAGSSLDFMRVYAQLATRLQPIMMKRAAHPTAAHAGQLLGLTPSMTEAEVAAVQAVRLLNLSSSSLLDSSEAAVEEQRQGADGRAGSAEQEGGE